MELKRLSLLDERVKDKYLVNGNGEVFNLSNKPLKVDRGSYKLVLVDGGFKKYSQSVLKELFNGGIKLLEGEEFKIIPFNTHYKISNYGRVISLKGGNEKLIKTHLNKKGRKNKVDEVVYLSIDGEEKRYSIHRLIMLVFNPIENSELYDVHHINCNHLDNRLENLQWLTKEEHKKLHSK